MSNNPINLWATGPHGPSCGDPFYTCKACRATVDDPPVGMDRCPHCAFNPGPDCTMAWDIKRHLAEIRSYESNRSRAIAALEDLVPLAVQVLRDNNVPDLTWSPSTSVSFRIRAPEANKATLTRFTMGGEDTVSFYPNEKARSWKLSSLDAAPLDLLEDLRNELKRMLSR